MKIIEAKEKHIPIIQGLSDVVWPITFADILSADQIKFMMEMMYSTEALREQMTDGHRYALVQEGDIYLGYLSIQHFEQEFSTKIHKIYILPDQQGKGVGRQLIEYAKEQAKKNGSLYLTLNVNRYNKALYFYQHLGFAIAGKEDIDIGNGFLMEDYKLKMNIR